MGQDDEPQRTVLVSVGGDVQQYRDRLMSGASVVALAMYLALCNIGLIGGLVVLWPGSEEFLGIKSPPTEIQYLLISVIAGGLGSIMPLMLSLATFVGNRWLTPTWGLWYLLRPFIGATVGLFVYMTIRGGILKTGNSADDLNHYGVAGFALIGGLYSQQILEKAQFVTRFRVDNRDT